MFSQGPPRSNCPGGMNRIASRRLPCYVTRQSAGVHSLFGFRTHGAFRLCSAGCATLSPVAHRLCLISNHVHLIVIAHQTDALALAFNRAHGQYASYWNFPANVTLREVEGETEVAVVDADAMLSMVGNQELQPIANEASQRLQRVLEGI